MEQGALEAIIAMLIKQFPALSGVLMILGSLVVLGQVVVILTPSKSDEEAYNKIMGMPIVGTLLTVISKFSIIQKK